MNPIVLKKFSHKDSSSPVIFEGDLCEAYVPKRYGDNYGALVIRESVKTLGVFDVIVDGVLTGLFIPSHVEMYPSQIEEITMDGETYVKLSFHKGDVFLKSLTVVKAPLASFPVYKEMITLGKTMKSIPYEEFPFIFHRLMKVSGINFRVNRALFEVIGAQVTRSLADITIPYRNTDMKGEYQQIPLNDVSHAATSTTSRMVGAWFKDGINAALVHPNDVSSSIEDVLRL